jgi:hypothetical protein
MGGLLNMGGKWVGDKVANAVNKLLTARGNYNLSGLFGDMLELGDLVEQATKSIMQKITNYATKQLRHATGGFVDSFLYILLNQIISGLVSSLY